MPCAGIGFSDKIACRCAYDRPVQTRSEVNIIMVLEGIISAMLTPLIEDESINEQQLRVQVNRQIQAGVAAVFCLGTNGEFYAFDFEEKKKIIDIVVEETAGRVPVLAGTGCITTAETVALTSYAKQAGVDAVSVISPYFAGISQDGLYQHFSRVATECELPVIMYNIPARTGVNISWQTVKKLAEHPYIIGIKDSSGNFDNTLRYIEETPDDFIVLCGNDSLILWTLMAGGNGGISGVTNIYPEHMVKIYKLFKQGDLKAARKAQDDIRCIRDCFAGYNPNSVVKRATALLGYDVGPARAPFAIQDPALDEKLKKAFAALAQLTGEA